MIYYPTLTKRWLLYFTARQTPFRMAFKTDADEVNGALAAATSELSTPPLGTIGFSLKYVQQAC